ncbi:MAG: alpha-ketoglutarate-dependent dioxygenase AlkB [Pseudomonadota bacterium]
MSAPLLIRDFKIYPEFLTLPEQKSLVEELRVAAAETPPFQPILRGGKRMSVKITSFGERGWLADGRGYVYAAHHPNGKPWPPIPASVLRIWTAVSGVARLPDSCLMNYYAENTKMGMHQDKDEAGFDWPVVSVSLGDEALFRMGNVARGGKTESIWLRSGDVVVMGGSARLAHHGIDRIKFGTSALLKQGGRLNLTLRVSG